MTNKILITLDEPTENALRKLAEDSNTTMSRVVRDLIIPKQSTGKIEVESVLPWSADLPEDCRLPADSAKNTQED